MSRTYFLTSAALGARGELLTCLPIQQVLESHGYTRASTPNSDLYISFEYDKKTLMAFEAFAKSGSRAFMVRMEPPAVYPAQYRNRVTEKFDHIFSPGTYVDRQNDILWPYYYNLNPAQPDLNPPTLKSIIGNELSNGEDLYASWCQRPMKMSLVAANKVSPINAANYGLRRKFAKQMSQSELAVFGALWRARLGERIRHRIGVAKFAISSGIIPNIKSIYGGLFSSFQNSLGTVEDKHRVIRDSRFSLVIENSNSFVSEKIYDALLGGSIPVYIGANLTNYGPLADVAIQVSGAVQSVRDVLRNLEPEAVKSYLSKIDSLVKSDVFQNSIDGDQVFRRIGDEIVKRAMQ